MKFSHSSSDNSFSANFGCFSSFLSRILCSKGLQTHPIERVKKQDSTNIENLVDGSATPNVVARLMGLDTMPGIDSKIARKGFGHLSRSKSMGSKDFRGETEEMQGMMHRRVKTSFSFRETPTYFELEDDNFFVLSFETSVKDEKKRSKLDNFDEFGKNKHKRREKCKRKQRRNREEQAKDRVFSDEERVKLKISPPNSQRFDNNVDVTKQSYHLSPFKENISSSRKEMIDGIKAKKKKKKENCLEEIKNELVCLEENYSPVSVLDDSEFISDPEFTASEEEARSRGSESVSQDSSSSNNVTTKEQEQEVEENVKRNVGLKRRDYKKHENIDMLRRICKLAEAEVHDNSNWKYRGMLRSQELEDTGAHFGQLIFDQLVSELVDLLVEL